MQAGGSWPKMLGSIIDTLVPVGERFNIEDVYAYEDRLAREFPNNRNIRASIRDTLQKLRKFGDIEFIDYEGTYLRLFTD